VAKTLIHFDTSILYFGVGKSQFTKKLKQSKYKKGKKCFETKIVFIIKFNFFLDFCS
jgi:hypothetical protein